MIQQGSKFPNMFLKRPDGTSMEVWDLHQEYHGLFIFADDHFNEILALAGRFQDQAKLFDWLKTKLVVVFKDKTVVPTPWPAPDYPACYYPDFLPDGMEWGRAYLVSRFRSVFELYTEPEFLSVARLEKDILYYEANHC